MDSLVEIKRSHVRLWTSAVAGLNNDREGVSFLSLTLPSAWHQCCSFSVFCLCFRTSADRTAVTRWAWLTWGQCAIQREVAQSLRTTACKPPSQLHMSLVSTRYRHLVVVCARVWGWGVERLDVIKHLWLSSLSHHTVNTGGKNQKSQRSYGRTSAAQKQWFHVVTGSTELL